MGSLIFVISRWKSSHLIDIPCKFKMMNNYIYLIPKTLARFCLCGNYSGTTALALNIRQTSPGLNIIIPA